MFRRATFLSWVPASALGLATLGASGVSVPPAPALLAFPDSARCLVQFGPGDTLLPDTIRVALTEPVHLAAAPLPANDAERLVFRQMFETLVRVDCEGNLVPGAALSWSTVDSGSSWTVTLGDSLRTWHNRPVRAADIVAGWAGRMDPAFMSVAALGDRTLRIFLARPVPEPRFLADPGLSLTPSGVGTGQYHPDSVAVPGHLRLLPTDSGRPVLDFLTATGDPRDQLDRGADLLVTDDPSLIEYAEGSGDRTAVALPWSRTYSLVLTQPAESLPPALAPLTDSLRATEFRRALARDAVRAESRESRLPTWDSHRSCGGPITTGRPSDRGRVYYSPGDQTAQDLAERLVALVPRRYGWRAAGMVPSGSDGRAGASFIVADGIADGPTCAVLGPGTIRLPLVDTRARAIVHRGAGVWIAEGDGTLRLEKSTERVP